MSVNLLSLHPCLLRYSIPFPHLNKLRISIDISIGTPATPNSPCPSSSISPPSSPSSATILSSTSFGQTNHIAIGIISLPSLSILLAISPMSTYRPLYVDPEFNPRIDIAPRRNSISSGHPHFAPWIWPGWIYIRRIRDRSLSPSAIRRRRVFLLTAK